MKPSLQISLLVALLALTGCGTGKQSIAPQTSPYLEETKAIELQAIDALQLGNYQQAHRLYAKAFDAYSAVDQIDGMARQLINSAQVLLIVERFTQAEDVISRLGKLISANGLDQHEGRHTLLQANLAIGQQRFRDGLEYLEHMVNMAEASNPTIAAAKVSHAVAQWHLGSDSSEQLEASITAPLIRARLHRLLAEKALAESDFASALTYNERAKAAYRTAAFAPGIAEVLILDAKLALAASDHSRYEHLRQRAKDIFERLGNQNAVLRHKL